MRIFLTAITTLLMLCACHESIEERAAREAKDYTEKYCPTPPQNNVITDSLTFDKATLTQTTYMTFTGDIDNAEAIAKVTDKLKSSFLDALRQNTAMKTYKDAKFTFAYVARSQKDPKKILLQMSFGPKDYK